MNEKKAQEAQHVCGFIFNQSGSLVVLSLKAAPEWQRSRLNGVGGRVMKSEFASEAISRIALEKTGLKIPQEHWFGVCHETGPGYRTFYMATFHPDLNSSGQMTATKSEVPDLFPLDAIPWHRCVGSVRWLIPLALDRTVQFPVAIEANTEAPPIFQATQTPGDQE